MTHPDQPLCIDPLGTVRFRANAIVRFLSRKAGLNTLATMDFSDDDWSQFAQLIGYSLSGWGDLSYVSDAAYARAAAQEPTP